MDQVLDSMAFTNCEKCKVDLRIIRLPSSFNVSIVFKGKALHLKDELTEELIQEIKEKLPRQPWPSGIGKKIAEELALAPSAVSKAIDLLMSRGDFKVQVHGKLYVEDPNQPEQIKAPQTSEKGGTEGV
jgi:hypothetical protein